MAAEALATEGHDILIKDAMVFLFAAGIVVPTFRFLKVPAVVAFMISGVLLGPFVIGAIDDTWPVLEFLSISDPHAVQPFAELGVLFLLFLLGLEFSFAKLWGLRRIVFGAGGLQAGLSAIAVALLAAFAFRLETGPALVCGLALALSSTAIVMQMLVDNKQAAQPVGRTSFGVLLFQDILVAPILIFVALISAAPGTSLFVTLSEALIQGLLAIGVIFLIGRFVLARVFKLAAMTGGREFLMAVTLLTVIGAAAATAGAGLSMALGAFLAGILLGETEFKHQTEIDLEPFKGILLGLFFVTVGMSLDLSVIASQPFIILAGLLTLLSVKLLIAYLAIRFIVKSHTTAVESAFFLAPAGEFAFVVFGAAGAVQLLPDVLSTQLSAIAGLSMTLTPLMARLGSLIASRMDRTEEADIFENIDQSGHVIIAGYGRVGQAVARVLSHEDVKLIIVDKDPKLSSLAKSAGYEAYLGDASRPEMLKAIGIAEASLFIVTVDLPNVVINLVSNVRKLRPDIGVLARAHNFEHANRLTEAGANYVVPEVIETGLQLAGAALRDFGYDGKTARAKLELERPAEYHRPEETVAPAETT